MRVCYFSHQKKKKHAIFQRHLIIGGSIPEQIWCSIFVLSQWQQLRCSVWGGSRPQMLLPGPQHSRCNEKTWLPSPEGDHIICYWKAIRYWSLESWWARRNPFGKTINLELGVGLNAPLRTILTTNAGTQEGSVQLIWLWPCPQPFTPGHCRQASGIHEKRAAPPKTQVQSPLSLISCPCSLPPPISVEIGIKHTISSGKSASRPGTRLQTQNPLLPGISSSYRSCKGLKLEDFLTELEISIQSTTGGTGEPHFAQPSTTKTAKPVHQL